MYNFLIIFFFFSKSRNILVIQSDPKCPIGWYERQRNEKKKFLGDGDGDDTKRNEMKILKISYVWTGRK